MNILKLRMKTQRMQPLNIIIGASGTKYDGWLSTNVDIFDITVARDWHRIFKLESIDRLLAEHVLEHLSESECKIALEQAYRYLKQGGIFRIAVPDGYRLDKKYIDWASPPKDDHKILFNVDTLSFLLKSVGFNVTPLEYFELGEKFHCLTWDVTDGFIRRSFRFDKREYFKYGDLYYTSLIVDAKKT